RAENLSVDPLVGQRVAGIVAGVAIFALPVVALATTGWDATGAVANLGSAIDPAVPDIEGIGRVLFTRYIFALEISSILLAIAVVGAVMLAKKSPMAADMIVDLPEPPTPADEPVDDAAAPSEEGTA